MRPRFATIGRYYRTISHLRAAQLWHRARLRAKKFAYCHRPAFFEKRWRQSDASHAQWPDTFLSLDQELPPQCPSAECNSEGIFEFLGERRDLGKVVDWAAPDAPQLWRYNLHYWEWAFALADHPDRMWAQDRFLALWRSWRTSTTVGRWDAWSPYVASIRAWVFCNLYGPLVSQTTGDRDFTSDLAMHARFLRANLELDVGGNHLIKNLKALVGLGIFLADEDLRVMAVTELVSQLAVQVLADGGHYERSPSYHCQVLGDVLDVHQLLQSMNLPEDPALDSTIAAMRRWLGVMIMPDGELPLFNDAWQLPVAKIQHLRPTPRPQDHLTVLRESGYAVLRPDNRIHLVADVGDPCPPDLPAHAHADCLSFELSFNGRRVIVDPGVTTYAPGAQRRWERSTAAHNTVEIDGCDQTEVWGTFRAGRLAHATILEASERRDGRLRLVASHDGYRHLPGHPEHRRTFIVEPGKVLILDQIAGLGVHTMKHRLNMARWEPTSKDILTLSVSETSAVEFVRTTECVPGRPASVQHPNRPAIEQKVVTLTAPLPVCWHTTIEV